MLNRVLMPGAAADSASRFADEASVALRGANRKTRFARRQERGDLPDPGDGREQLEVGIPDHEALRPRCCRFMQVAGCGARFPGYRTRVPDERLGQWVVTGQHLAKTRDLFRGKNLSSREKGGAVRPDAARFSS